MKYNNLATTATNLADGIDEFIHRVDKTRHISDYLDSDDLDILMDAIDVLNEVGMLIANDSDIDLY